MVEHFSVFDELESEDTVGAVVVLQDVVDGLHQVVDHSAVLLTLHDVVPLGQDLQTVQDTVTTLCGSLLDVGSNVADDRHQTFVHRLQDAWAYQHHTMNNLQQQISISIAIIIWEVEGEFHHIFLVDEHGELTIGGQSHEDEGYAEQEVRFVRVLLELVEVEE